MHPISFKFLAKHLGLLLSLIALALVVQDFDRHGVLTALAAGAFVYGTIRVARHVLNLTRRHRHLGWLVIIGVQILAVIFTALFLSSTFVGLAFLLLEIIAFVYFAIIN